MLVATYAVTIPIKAINISPNHMYRSLNILRTIGNPPAIGEREKLQNKLRQVRILRQIAHMLLHIGLINRHRFAGTVRG